MTLTQKRIVILLIVIAAGVILGRLAVRAGVNALLGGTMFEGIFYDRRENGEKERTEEGQSNVGNDLCVSVYHSIWGIGGIQDCPQSIRG